MTFPATLALSQIAFHAVNNKIPADHELSWNASCKWNESVFGENVNGSHVMLYVFPSKEENILEYPSFSVFRFVFVTKLCHKCGTYNACFMFGDLNLNFCYLNEEIL